MRNFAEEKIYTQRIYDRQATEVMGKEKGNFQILP